MELSSHEGSGSGWKEVQRSVDRVPLRSYRTYYSTFYALRLRASVRSRPVEVIRGKDGPRLACGGVFKGNPPLQPVLDSLFHLLLPYGVAGFERCFADPSPIIEIVLEDRDASVVSLLQNMEDISFRVWLTFFRALSADQEGEGATKSPITPAACHSGSDCRIDLLFLAPSSHRKEVDIFPITLANRQHVEDMATSSMVFDFSSAMMRFLNEPTSKSTKEIIDMKELEAELSGMANWFHLGMILEVPEATLLKILMDHRHAEPCRAQVLRMWLERCAGREDGPKPSWSLLARAVKEAGRASVAQRIARKYCVPVPAGGSSPTFVSASSKRKPSKLESILGDLELSDLQEVFEEKDHELMEKRKVLDGYLKERKFVEMSIQQLVRTFEELAADASRLAREKVSLGERLKSLRNEIVALESLVLSDEEEGESGPDEERVGANRQGGEGSPLPRGHSETFRAMMSERKTTALAVMNELKKNESELDALRKQTLALQEVLFRESAQLTSKSQQIHQLKRILSQIHARIATESSALDRLLQQKIAARNKPKPPVFQLQINVAKEEISENQQQLKILGRSKDLVEEQVSNDQQLVQKTEASLNKQLEAVKSSERTKPEQDQALVELLHLIQNWTGLRQRLLEEKENRWRLERGAWAVTSNMNRLREFVASVTKAEDIAAAANGRHEEDELTLEECTIVPGKNLMVNIDRSTRFSLAYEEKAKINVRKNTFSAELHSLVSGSTLSSPVGVKATKPVTLATIFCPTVRGRHLLHIKINSTPIRGSPFSIYVKQPPTSLGAVVKELQGFEYPYAAAVTTGSRHLAVSECRKSEVSITDLSTGKKVKTLGSNGRNQLKIPNGIAVDQDGFLFIADSGNHQILKYSPEGTLVSSTGTKGEKLSEFHFPYGVTLSPGNHLCICDHNNHRIKVLTTDELKCNHAIPTTCPYDITFDKDGRMYVTDRKNHAIRVYQNRKKINDISSSGSEAGELLEPRGICTDRQGYVYVVEETNCRVSVFDASGEFVAWFGGEGNSPGKFNSPQGITIDDDGFVYVCDMLNNRVQVF